MKFYNSEFTIDAKYANELRNKVAVFSEQTNIRKPIFITLVTTFGTRENSHKTSLEVIDLKMDVLF